MRSNIIPFNNYVLDCRSISIKIILVISNISLIKMIRNNELKLVTLLFVVAFLTTWIMPLGVIFAEEEEESLLHELTGEEEIISGEGKIEVLGITEEQVPILGNRFLIVILTLIVAAVGGLILSFVIKART